MTKPLPIPTREEILLACIAYDMRLVRRYLLILHRRQPENSEMIDILRETWEKR